MDIPLDPRRRHQEEWVSWGDWLGTNYVSTNRRVYRDFESAKKYIQSIKIQSSGEYLEWSKTKEQPEDIPANPPKSYKDHWTTWGDFL